MMKKPKSLQSLIRHFWMMGAFLSLLFPAVASAASTVGNPAIIEQLEIVKATLAALDAKMDALAIELAAQGGDVDFLVEDAKSVTKDIKISSSLCFGASYFKKIAIGLKLEAGGGWPNVAHLKGVIQVDAKVHGIGINLGEKICIKVPLFKIASDPLASFDNTEDFDQLIADIVAPSQALIPAVATLYTAVMPSKDQVIQATANVINAATGFDIITGDQGTPNPGLLLHPEILLAPVLTEPYQAFLDFAPNAVGILVTDPCGFLAASPLQININIIPICNIASGGTHLITDLFDPLHLIHVH